MQISFGHIQLPKHSEPGNFGNASSSAELSASGKPEREDFQGPVREDQAAAGTEASRDLPGKGTGRCSGSGSPSQTLCLVQQGRKKKRQKLEKFSERL